MADDFISYEELEKTAVNLLNRNIDKSVGILQTTKNIEPKMISPINYYKTAGHEYAYEFYDLAKIEQTLKNIKYAESEDTLLQIIDISSSEIEKTSMNLFNTMDINVDVLYKKDTDLLEEEIIEKIYILKGTELIVENMLKGIAENSKRFARSVLETHNNTPHKALEYANKRISNLKKIKEEVQDDLVVLKNSYTQMIKDSQIVIEKIHTNTIASFI